MNKWDDLSELEQTRFIIRYLREINGMTDQMLEHTYNGDDGPDDSGIIDWKRYQEELITKKDKKTKKGATKDAKRKNNVEHESDTLQMFDM